MASHFLLRVVVRVLKRVKRVVVVHLKRDLRGLARAKRIKCLQSWMRMVVGSTRSVLLKKRMLMHHRMVQRMRALVCWF